MTKIPEPSWEGWSPVLEALGIERGDAQRVADAVERAQLTLSGLLNAALHTETRPPAARKAGEQPQVRWLGCALASLRSVCRLGGAPPQTGPHLLPSSTAHLRRRHLPRPAGQAPERAQGWRRARGEGG